MRMQTAANIINKLVVGGYTVSLRKNKHGGISDKTYDALADILFTVYNAKTIHVSYSKNNTMAFMNAIHKDGHTIFEANIKLFSTKRK